MKYVVVVPYAYQPYFDEFRATLKIPEENCLFIDDTNPVGGIGIMKAHNLGVDFMQDRNADWLIIMSASIRFGERGGLDFIEELDKHPDALLLHGSGMWVENGTGTTKRQALGWHLTAFRKVVFDVIGNWDENFSPYGLDDTDLTLRMLKGFGDSYKIEVADVDMRHESTSHSINLAQVKSAYPPRNSYFRRKWGRHGGDWQNSGYQYPFADASKGLNYWPKPNDIHSIQMVEFAGMEIDGRAWTIND